MDIPKTCLSFSPNWFYPQIVVCTAYYLIYGANDGLYIYNYIAKRFQSHINIGIKITLVFVDANKLFVALEGGSINMYDINISPPKYLGKIELNMSKIIIFLRFGIDQFLVLDERGVGIQIKLKDNKIINFQIKVMNQPHDKPKSVIPLNNGNFIVFYEKGRIFMTPNIEINYAFKILHVDYQDNQIVLLNKKSNKIALHIIKYSSEEDLRLKLLNWSHQENQNEIFPEQMISNDERFYFIKMIMNDKLPIIDKACLTIKFIGLNKLIVTSRQGEYYIVRWDQNSVKYQEITLNPKSIENSQIQDNLIKATKSPLEAHYKMIYLINQVQYDSNSVNQMYYSVGTDRRICLFRLNEQGDLELYWKLILLASRVTKIQFCPTEKNLMFFSGPELSLRSLDMQKNHDQCYVNEFWRGVPQFSDFSFHPQYEGVLAFINSDTKIIICDIYKETQICQFDLKEPISQIFWFSDVSCLLSLIATLDQLKPKDQINSPAHQQYPVVRTDMKNLKKDYNLQYMVIIKGNAKLTIISLKTYQTIYEDTFFNTFQLKSLIKQKFSIVPELITLKTSLFTVEQNSNFIHIMMVYNQQFLLNLVYYYEQKRVHVDILKCHQQITCIANKTIDHNSYTILGGVDRNVQLYTLKDNKLFQLGHLKHRQPIHKVKLNQNLCIIAIAKQSQTVQIWNVTSWVSNYASLDQSKDEILKLDGSYNIRGHVGFIIDAEFDPQNSLQVITSSDDQTLKVWDLSTIQNTKPPNKKKIKKKSETTKKVKLNSGISQKQQKESDSEVEVDDDDDEDN